MNKFTPWKYSVHKSFKTTSSVWSTAVSFASAELLKLQKVNKATQQPMRPLSLRARLCNQVLRSILHLTLTITGVIFPILLYPNCWLIKFEKFICVHINWAEYEFMSA